MVPAASGHTRAGITSRRACLARPGPAPDARGVRALQPLQLSAHTLWRARRIRYRGPVGRRGRGDGGARLHAHRRRILAGKLAPSLSNALPLDVVDGAPDRRHVRPRRRPAGVRANYDLGLLDLEYEIVHAVEPNPNAAPRPRVSPASGFPWAGSLTGQTAVPLGVVRARQGRARSPVQARATRNFPPCARAGTSPAPTPGAGAPAGPRWATPSSCRSSRAQARGDPEAAQAADGRPAQPAQRASQPAAGRHHLHRPIRRQSSRRRSRCASTSAPHDGHPRDPGPRQAGLLCQPVPDDGRERPPRDHRARDRRAARGEDADARPGARAPARRAARSAGEARVQHHGARPPVRRHRAAARTPVSSSGRFTSMLAQAQKAVATGAIERFWQFGSQIAALSPKPSTGSTPTARWRPMPNDRRPGRRHRRARQGPQGPPARAQAQQQQAALANVQQLAATAKDASQIDVGGGANAVQPALGRG